MIQSFSKGRALLLLRRKFAERELIELTPMEVAAWILSCCGGDMERALSLVCLALDEELHYALIASAIEKEFCDPRQRKKKK